ncbi:Ankyrin repeat domain-containing protein 23 [Apiospora hydei]|uniref:Ankyrin repeat domain-containing protein 23 n=1 Tax=Apiospora hydei TaxID=1337664 RepID=A0ABR1VYE8_9PEZI
MEAYVLLSTKRSLVCLAARNNWADAIPRLLGMGLDSNELAVVPDQGQLTALHEAVVFGSEEAALSLIKAGASLDLCNNFGETALMMAITKQRLGIVDFLLDRGANATLHDLHGNSALTNAIRQNLLQVVTKILRRGADEGTQLDTRTSLQVAAVCGAHAVIDVLIEHGADLEYMDNDGYTALHNAVLGYRSNMALLLISRGHMLAATATDKNGATALHQAAEQGNETVVRRLLDCGCEPHPEDKLGRTPFWLAVYNQQREVVDLYLSRGLDEVVTRRGPRRNCALAAARSGDLGLWRKVVAIDKTLVSDVDPEGDDGLCLAVCNGHTHMLEEVLAMGFDVNGKTEHGGTALSMAAMKGIIGSVRYLCLRGADLDSQDVHGLTALHWAAQGGFEECQSIDRGWGGPNDTR